MPAQRGRRGLGHRTVGCDRASYQQAAEGRAFHLDLCSGLRLSHSAAADANPATYRPLNWRRYGVVFRGGYPLPRARISPGDAVAHRADSAELFDIEMDELARMLAFITPYRFGRLQGTELVQSQPT